MKSSKHPLEWISCDIIEHAVRDWRAFGHLSKRPKDATNNCKAAFTMANKAGFAAPRDELVEFFNGRIFRAYCEIVGESIDPDAIVKHLGIPATAARMPSNERRKKALSHT